MHTGFSALDRPLHILLAHLPADILPLVVWHGIGLGDWLFDLDQPDEAAHVAPSLLAPAREPAAARPV